MMRECVAVLERISRLADDSGVCLCRDKGFFFIIFKFLKRTDEKLKCNTYEVFLGNISLTKLSNP